MSKSAEPQLTDNALLVLKRRYLTKDAQGRIVEKPGQLFWRVAKHIAAADGGYGADDTQIAQTAQDFYSLMAELDFLPNSPTLMNAGRSLGQLSACFVLPVGDSMEEIFEAIKNAAMIHKSGGGTGFSFSRLRPDRSVVASTQGVASGPVSFMKVFNAATEAVKQGGTRRGANMGILRVDHPDIMEFIVCKRDTTQITNFNISVAVSDRFMAALANSEPYELIDPRTGTLPAIAGRPTSLDPHEVLKLIVDEAWHTGEPGLVFIDRMDAANPTHPYETIEATNPCGEQPLPAYDSCNLGSINLGRFVRRPLLPDYSPDCPADGVDFDRLGSVVRQAVHFLDNVIDQNKYPLPQIREQTLRNRRIGLGVMGWADMLVKLQIPYNAPAAAELGERVMAFIGSEARTHSSELAKSRGVFPNWEHSVFARENVTMRNATVTTVAPTGTISILAGCSSGIEPYYAIAFERRVMDGTRLVEMNPLFQQALADHDLPESWQDKVVGLRSISDIDELPPELRALFLTAADISPEDHIRMQAAFQKHTDSSVSKTINFPESATRDDVKRAFLMAYESGCKGVTVYRDNSRPRQVLSTPQGETAEAGVGRRVQPRPAELRGVTEKIGTGYGNLYVTINFKDQRPFEVFAQIGHSGYTTMADTEAICRLVSLTLRSGVEVAQVVKQLRGIGGSSQIYSQGSKVASIPDAIAQVLARQAGIDPHGDDLSTGSAEICPDCGSAMRAASGCLDCPSCGYSSC
ncbi:MAG: vitamin B12-dependent ribonucleotide reductase [bacterium]